MTTDLIFAPSYVDRVLAYYFNLRTRSLNNVLFQFIMCPAPLALSYVMDTTKVKSRRLRGLLGTTIMGTVCLATCFGLLAWIRQNHIDKNIVRTTGVDWTDSGFAAGLVLYILFGMIYSTYQLVVQWTLAALTNNLVKCARYAGMFKGTTSLGMCVAFILNSKKVSYTIVQFA